MVKAGWKTTEFWLAMLTVGLAFVLAMTEKNNTLVLAFLGAGGIPSGAYSLGRSIAKRNGGS